MTRVYGQRASFNCPRKTPMSFPRFLQEESYHEVARFFAK